MDLADSSDTTPHSTVNSNLNLSNTETNRPNPKPPGATTSNATVRFPMPAPDVNKPRCDNFFTPTYPLRKNNRKQQPSARRNKPKDGIWSVDAPALQPANAHRAKSAGKIGIAIMEYGEADAADDHKGIGRKAAVAKSGEPWPQRKVYDFIQKEGSGDRVV
ncbi:hypothetical protein BDW74DRAFT_180092 [Aspergillus multicolor]|uniref:uncharacterized protein n=1 Tax=Aspergillus multicolor TaxID=41759 RepID=UPI003CCCFE8C